MNIYLLQQDAVYGYDTYDSCVVIAENEQEAAKINPDGRWDRLWCRAWCRSPDQVEVTKIGIADADQKAGTVICASFNAS